MPTSARRWDGRITLWKEVRLLRYPFGQSLPASPISLFEKGRAVVAGGKLLVEWIGDDAPAVSGEIANRRAAVCVSCPKNERGDWTAFFTAPVSRAIRQELQRRKEMNLSTPFDSELNVCAACLCPLPLKVHVPLDRIIRHIGSEAMSNLAPGCWILSEQKSTQ